MKPTILIVEDSEATRQRLESVIYQGDRFQLVGSASNYHKGAEMLLNISPDILLTDLDLPDGSGIDLIKMLQLPSVQTKLAIVISIFGDGEHIINALKAGASGYLLKDDHYLDINNAISQMLEGGSPISPSIARYLLKELALAPTEKPAPNNDHRVLTKREHEVLVLVSKGYTANEISELLGLSHHTVKGYISDIYGKLSVNNKMQAVHEATLQGLL